MGFGHCRTVILRSQHEALIARKVGAWRQHTRSSGFRDRDSEPAPGSSITRYVRSTRDTAAVEESQMRDKPFRISFPSGHFPAFSFPYQAAYSMFHARP